MWARANRVAHNISVPYPGISTADLEEILGEFLEDVEVEWFTEPFAYDDAYMVDSVGLSYTWGWDDEFDTLHGEGASL